MNRQQHGASVGRAGASLQQAGTGFRANEQARAAGAAGEQATAAVLDRWAARTSGRASCVVIHDLVGRRGGTVWNIDHVMVGPRAVLSIDTKVWQTKVYWGRPGRPVWRASRRWFVTDRERFTPGETRAVAHSVNDLARASGLPTTGLVAVRASSRTGRLDVRRLRIESATVIDATDLDAFLDRWLRHQTGPTARLGAGPAHSAAHVAHQIITTPGLSLSTAA